MGTLTFLNTAVLADVARNAAKGATEQTNSGPPLVAVVFSAMAVEAAVNEILTLVAIATDAQPESVQRLRALIPAARLMERDASLETKIQLIAIALSGRPLSRDRQPLQDLTLLVATRNFLVHHRPEQIQTDDGELWTPSKMMKQLASRGLVSAPQSPELPSAVATLSMPSVAVWAFATACAMVNELVNHFPPGYIRTMHMRAIFDSTR